MTEAISVCNDDSRVITVWSDIGCPWATLALHTLRSEIRERQAQVTIDHRAFPLELFNSRPTPKPIIDAEVVAIAGLREDLEWRQWSAPEWSFAVTTLPALEAVQAAKAPGVGGLVGSDQLDAALRRALYTDHQCISVFSTIMDVASTCPDVDVSALDRALREGVARQSIFDQWSIAQRPEIICSPHVMTSAGASLSNPGVRYHWSGSGGGEAGFPRLDSYDTAWASSLIADMVSGADRSTSREVR